MSKPNTNQKKNNKNIKNEMKEIKKTKFTKEKRDTNKKSGSYVLVIVESPGKIKKLESILGTGYKVMSSFGHIMDLDKNELSVDVENNFEPTYKIITGNKKFEDKKQVVKELKTAASQASKVIFAADRDREGEMIAWSYKQVLGLSEEEYERITFKSITEQDVKHAMENPEKINTLMVDSQKTRRILDRLVGFKISPKINQIMGMRKLSAGRAQSIVVKLICEREDEINDFFNNDNASYFKIKGNFKSKVTQIDMKCELISVEDTKQQINDDYENGMEREENEEKEVEEDDEDDEDDKFVKTTKAYISSYEKADKLMKKIVESTFTISNVSVRKSIRYPSAPFTTSSAQQEASTKLKLPVKRTMSALQKLYEAGYTTYLRTDSTNLSNDALEQCTKYVENNFGKEYHNLKNYTNKKGNTQEAHEAIRPVDIGKRTVPNNGKIGIDEQQVYDLVWKRTVASQMSSCQVNVYTIDIEISKEKKYLFRTTIEDIIFPGYLALENKGTHGQLFDNISKTTNNHIDEKIYKTHVPKKSENVIANEINCTEEYKKPPLRYSESGLIKKMDPKNLNIGRPATYAEIINTIQKRKYVEIKEDILGVEKKSRTLYWQSSESDKVQMNEKIINLGREKKKFCPTILGNDVNKIMMRNFQELMEYKFTSNMEKQLDEIAEGNLPWVECLKIFWNKLEPLLEQMDNEKKKLRILGKHPKSGYDVIARMGPYTPIVSMARSEKKTDDAIAPIKSPYNIETITLEQAIEILKYPKLLGVHNKKNVELKTSDGRFYVTCGKMQNAKIPCDVDIETIDLKVALKYIKEKEENKKTQIANHLYHCVDGKTEYIINNGKYGENNKYIKITDLSKKKDNVKFITFPEYEDVTKITLIRLKEIVKEHFENKYKKKKTKVSDCDSVTNTEQFDNIIKSESMSDKKHNQETESESELFEQVSESQLLEQLSESELLEQVTKLENSHSLAKPKTKAKPKDKAKEKPKDKEKEKPKEKPKAKPKVNPKVKGKVKTISKNVGKSMFKV